MSPKYEIWDISTLGHGEPPTPLFMHKAYYDFTSAYIEYTSRCIKVPCVIMYKSNYDKKETEKYD